MTDTKIDILQTSAFPARIEAELQARYHVHRMTPETQEEMLAGIGGSIRALVTTAGKGAPKPLMNRLPRLEIIAVGSVGYETIDVPYAASRGVVVTNTPDVLNDDVADLAIALLIMASRRLVAADRFVRAGKWPDGEFPLSASIHGKRLGILGLGRIGKAIAHRAEALGLSIAYTNRKPADSAYRFVADPVALARDSDFLVVAASAGPASANLVNRAVIEALGPRGILVNVSRGMVVDEAELVAALGDGRLGGAGLDVFAREPQVPSALFDLDNVVLLPHLGSATVETRDAMGQLVLDNLAAHFAGRPLLTPVSP